MSDEGWIDIRESLPGLGKKVEIKCIDRDGNQYPGTAKFIQTDFCEIKLYLIDIMRRADAKILYWRPIPEKLPDFGMLRNGDLINFEYFEEKCVNIKISGYVHYLNADNRTFDIQPTKERCPGQIKYDYKFKNTKNIYRINIVDQTVEEI